MREHLARNGLADVSTVINAAAWHKDDVLKFPAIDSRADHGAAATTTGATNTDYRGHKADFIYVSAYSVPTIAKDMQTIDFMHWDIQGAEASIADHDIEFLNEHVRFLFIGTHSRAIEGKLLELFRFSGWELIHEHPCNFVWDLAKPTLTGMVHTDGELFLRNPVLRKRYDPPNPRGHAASEQMVHARLPSSPPW